MGEKERAAFADDVCAVVRAWIMADGVENLRVELADGADADLPHEAPPWLKKATAKARTLRLHVNGGYAPVTHRVMTPAERATPGGGEADE